MHGREKEFDRIFSEDREEKNEPNKKEKNKDVNTSQNRILLSRRRKEWYYHGTDFESKNAKIKTNDTKLSTEK